MCPSSWKLYVDDFPFLDLRVIIIIILYLMPSTSQKSDKGKIFTDQVRHGLGSVSCMVGQLLLCFGSLMYRHIWVSFCRAGKMAV